MMKRLRPILILTTILLFVSMAFAGPFPEFEDDGWHDMNLSVVTVYTTGHGVGIYPDVFYSGKLRKGIGVFEIEGNGFVVAPGLVVTAAHVVNPVSVMIQEDTHCYFDVPIVDIRDRTISLGEYGTVPATIAYIDKDYDLALLRYPASKANFKPLPNRVMRTIMGVPMYGPMDLLEGKEVFAMVRMRDKDLDITFKYILRSGKVIASGPTLPKGYEDELPFFSFNEFTMTTKVYPGDSGSPVFVVFGDEAFIVGVVTKACLVCPENTSYATRIDPLVNMILAETQ